MKTLIAALLLAPALAHASILGFLVTSQMGTSVTGRLVWECTYNVSGSYQVVTLGYLCPQSMQFE